MCHVKVMEVAAMPDRFDIVVRTELWMNIPRDQFDDISPSWLRDVEQSFRPFLLFRKVNSTLSFLSCLFLSQF